MPVAYIGLGSNLGDREAALRAALEELRARRMMVRKVSAFRNTTPVGKTEQPDFLNAVAEIETDLPPEELLAMLLGIEKKLGRVRGERWGPRVIDLDLLLYGDRVIRSEDLILPHPRMHERRFVLEPLAEIAPDLVHPVLKKAVNELLQKTDDIGFLITDIWFFSQKRGRKMSQ